MNMNLSWPKVQNLLLNVYNQSQGKQSVYFQNTVLQVLNNLSSVEEITKAVEKMIKKMKLI